MSAAEAVENVDFTSGSTPGRRYAIVFTAIVVIYCSAFGYYLIVTMIRRPFMDMFSYVSSYLDYLQTGNLWRYLWAPHAQHRLMWIRLLTALDIAKFKGIAYPFTLFATACLVSVSGLLRHEIQRTEFSEELKYFVGWLIVMLVLTTANVVDCSIPIEGIYPHTLIFAVLSIVLLGGQGAGNDAPYIWRLAAMVAVMAAALGSAAGLVVWPILIWMAWRSKAGWPWTATVAALGSVFCGFYVYGMPLPDSVLSALHGEAQFFRPAHLLKITDYFISYFGLPWTRSSSLALAGRGIGLIFSVAGVACTLRFGFLRRNDNRLERIAVGLIMFSLLTGALAAVGRVDETPDVHVPVRYSVYLAPLHIGILYLCMPWLDRQWRKFEGLAAGRIAVVLAAGLLLVQQVAAGQSAVIVARNIRATISRFQAGERDAAVAHFIFPNMDFAQRTSDRMKSAGIYASGMRPPID